LQTECKNSLFTRRAFIRSGMAGSLGIPLFNPLSFRAADAAVKQSRLQQRIRSCIVLFYYGGPSHLDTFDLKPNAPKEIRGEFQPIATSAPGLQISEHLPHTARVMHHTAVIRSMHHTNRLHDSASTECLTGRQSPQGDREEFSPIPQFTPCYGATLSYMWRARQLDVFHAALPWVFHNVIDVPCQGGGFLGKAYDPFRITGDLDTLRYRAEVLATPEGLSSQRRAERQTLLETLDAGGLFASSEKVRQLQSLYEKAYKLLDSKKIAQALNIEQEDQKTRDRYGRGENGSRGGGNGAEKAYGRNLRGQNFLMARRLVEAGVPFVNVYDFKQQGQNWDSHADNFNQHKDHLLKATLFHGSVRRPK